MELADGTISSLSVSIEQNQCGAGYAGGCAGQAWGKFREALIAGIQIPIKTM